MFCVHCGTELPNVAAYCMTCGTAAVQSVTAVPDPRTTSAGARVLLPNRTGADGTQPRARRGWFANVSRIKPRRKARRGVSMRLVAVGLVCLIAGVPIIGQVPDNSNLWSVHRDVQSGFRLSYPPTWVVVPPKGTNVKFSVNPPDGAGNCNVVGKPSPQLAGMTQGDLNREIEELPDDAKSWAGYAGVAPSSLTLVDSRRARLVDVPALIATLEVALENLEGNFTRKQMIAFTITPGVLWSLNCGASTFKPEDARARFLQLHPTFTKIFGLFALLK